MTGKPSVTAHTVPRGTTVISIRQCIYKSVSYNQPLSSLIQSTASWNELMKGQSGHPESIPNLTTDALFLLPLHLSFPFTTQEWWHRTCLFLRHLKILWWKISHKCRGYYYTRKTWKLQIHVPITIKQSTQWKKRKNPSLRHLKSSIAEYAAIEKNTCANTFILKSIQF